MFEVLIQTIPSGINEYIFVIGIVFLLFLSSKVRKSGLFQACMIAALLMILWRIAIVIESSRYSIVLIYLFALVIAYQLSLFLKSKVICLKVFAIFLICGCLFFFGKKLYYTTQINQNINVIGDTIRRYADSRGNYSFKIQYDDYARIKHRSGIKENIYFTSTLDQQELNDLITNYKVAYQDLIVDYKSPRNDTDIIYPTTDKSKYRQILSLFVQKNKKKKYHCFLIKSNILCKAISPSEIAPIGDSILVNGDLELADSPEDSFKVLKKEIPGYEGFFGIDDTIRTPENAYFYFLPRQMPNFLHFDCTDIKPLYGARSAYINVRNGTAHLRFYQKVTSGNYKYSLLVRGNRGTNVEMQYLAFKKNKGNKHPLATFTLPDKRLYELSVSFSVDDLADNDYFRVAASVENGEAYLDQFSLTQAGQTDELQN